MYFLNNMGCDNSQNNSPFMTPTNYQPASILKPISDSVFIPPQTIATRVEPQIEHVIKIILVD